MDALSLYRAGQLREAIDALGVELKKQPLDARRRTFLFELLCFTGEYERAGKQLDILSDASPEAASGALLYRSALHAERIRQEMFGKDELPLSSAHPAAAGKLNDTEFSEIADSDPRIGANLEAFIAGSYNWIPLAYIESVTTQAPTRLRDLIWMPAIVRTTPEFRMQDLGEILLPVLAPLSWRSDDDMVRLGRETIWEEDSKYGPIPRGQKTMLAGDEEKPLLEVRELNFHHAGETAASAIT